MKFVPRPLKETADISSGRSGFRSWAKAVLSVCVAFICLYLVLGFVSDFRRQGLLIARFEGCPLTVRFPADGPIDDDTLLEVGWHPAWHVTHRYRLGRSEPAADGSRSLPMRQSCGAVWLRFHDTGLACEGADPEGRLVIESTRATPEVECRVRRTTHTARR